MKVSVPIPEPGCHTLLVAIELDDATFTDPLLYREVVRQTERLVRPVLARRRFPAEGHQLLAEHGTTLDEVCSYTRDAAVVFARQELVLFLRSEGWSLPAIGDLLGRDHTTVLHAERQAISRRQRAEQTQRRLEEVERDACEDCDRPSLGGGRWCLPCFQKHRRTA